MTFTWCRKRRKYVKGTCQLNENSGDTPKSECMRVKRTSGIWAASNQESAMFCREQLRQRNLEHACGEGRRSPTEEQGIKVLGAPVGHRDFVRKHLERILEQHELNGIPRVPDVQSAWLLLLHCASVRANFQLRVMRPECGVCQGS